MPLPPIRTDCALDGPPDYVYTFETGDPRVRVPRIGCTCDACAWNWKILKAEADKAIGRVDAYSLLALLPARRTE